MAALLRARALGAACALALAAGVPSALGAWSAPQDLGPAGDRFEPILGPGIDATGRAALLWTDGARLLEGRQDPGRPWRAARLGRALTALAAFGDDEVLAAVAGPGRDPGRPTFGAAVTLLRRPAGAPAYEPPQEVGSSAGRYGRPTALVLSADGGAVLHWRSDIPQGDLPDAPALQAFERPAGGAVAPADPGPVPFHATLAARPGGGVAAAFVDIPVPGPVRVVERALGGPWAAVGPPPGLERSRGASLEGPAGDDIVLVSTALSGATLLHLRGADGAWRALPLPVALSRPDVSPTVIAAGRDGTIAAARRAAARGRSRILASVRRPGGAFGPVATLDVRPGGSAGDRVAASVGPDGTVAVAWSHSSRGERGPRQLRSIVRAALAAPGRGLGRPRTLSDDDLPAFGLEVAAGRRGDAAAAWVASVGARRPDRGHVVQAARAEPRPLIALLRAGAHGRALRVRAVLGAAARVQLTLVRAGTGDRVARRALALPRGASSSSLTLPRALAPGRYRLQARAGAPGRRAGATAPLLVERVRPAR